MYPFPKNVEGCRDSSTKTTETRYRDGSDQATLQKLPGYLTNKNGYLSFTFVLSMLGIEQMYKECGICVATQEGLSGRMHDSQLVY